MVDNIELREKLRVFGLSAKEAEVYLVLVTSGWVTALQLSRKCLIKRTTLYRVLESLITLGLVEEKLEDKTTLYAGAPAENLANAVRDKELAIKEMKDILPGITEQIGWLKQVKPKEINVRFVRGVRGLQYLNLKHTRSTDKEVLIVDSNQWYTTLSREFAEEVRARVVKNGVRIRELTNHYDPKEQWTDNQEYLEKHYSFRLLGKQVMEITQDMYIFDNTIQFVGYNKNDLVGIEIESPEYATMLKQIFEVLWEMGTSPRTN